MQRVISPVGNAPVAAEGQLSPVLFGNQTWSCKKLLGEGAFGKVLLIEREGDEFAIKVVTKAQLSAANERRMRLEQRILELVKSMAFFVDFMLYHQNEAAHFFALKYYKGGDLQKRLTSVGTFDEDTARFYIGEIAVAVDLLHKMGYIHRDVKLENVLINDDGHIVLADFGLAKEVSNAADMDRCGTSLYMAPEVLMNKDYNGAIDVWAIGILTFEMLTGLHPFHQDIGKINTKMMKVRIQHEDPIFPEQRSISSKAVNFITRLLKKDPGSRLVITKDVSSPWVPHEFKLDPFFHPINWKALENRLLTPPYVPPLEPP